MNYVQESLMKMFQHVAKAATAGAVTAAEESGRDRVSPMAATLAIQPAAKPATPPLRKRAPPAAVAQSAAHRLILQVNPNDPAAMNLALNNATNVARYYKEN